jgi:hypothetical protein
LIDPGILAEETGKVSGIWSEINNFLTNFEAHPILLK